MSYKSYIILLVATASFLVSCNKSEEYFGLGKDGCLQFRVKMVDNLDVEEKMSKDSTYTRSDGSAVYTRDTIFIDSDVYVTADVDYINSNTVATRGVPLDSELKIPSLKVLVFNTKTYTWASSGQNRTLENKLSMPNSSGGNFDYTPLIPFTKDGNNRSFIAYSPIEGTGGVVKKSDTELNYTVPADVTGHPDICTSQLSGNTDVKNTGGGEHIRDFALKHELTAIGFALRGSEVKIISATITGVKTAGTLNLDTKVWSLGDATDARAAKIKQQFYNVGWTESWVDCTEPNGYLMMIPQTLTDDAKLTIVYQYNYGENKGKNLTLVSNLKALTGGVWVAGKRISYNIRLKADPSVTADDLLIDCSLAGYTTESTINMAKNVASDDVLTFTWDASWLKIHQGSPKENNTSGGATSGWSVAANKPLNNIYFFATGNNTSTMTRSATVTVRGKKSLERTFKVTQNAKPTLSVYPTSLTLSYFQQRVPLQITTNCNLQDISLRANDGSWLKRGLDESATLYIDCDWQVNPGNRSNSVTMQIYEKGNLAAEVSVPVTQNGSGRFIVLNDDERSVRSYVDQSNLPRSRPLTGPLMITNYCGNDKTLPSESLWSTILDKYVFTGRWENEGNITISGRLETYWTNEFTNPSGNIINNKAIFIYPARSYRFVVYNTYDRAKYTYRCVTIDGGTP